MVRARARLGGLIATVLVAVVLAGCGGPAAPTAAPTGATIEHRYGTTTVPAQVERVATVGWNDQDFVLGLGVVPVMTRSWFDAYWSFPWVRAVTKGAEVPRSGEDGIDLEAVAASRPDVIIAIYEDIDEDMYRKLSAIAPTVVQSSAYPPEKTPWDVQLLTTGKAIGREDLAEQRAAGVRDRIAAVRAAHPSFAGKVLVEDFGPENGGHYLIPAGDPRRALFDALGFATQEHSGDVSEERLDLLDRDVLFVNGATEQQMTASVPFARLDVVREGRTLYTTFSDPLGGALSYGGPDALLYAIDQLEPQLAAATTR